MAAYVQVNLSAFPSDGSAVNWPSGNRFTLGSEEDETRWLDNISYAKNWDRAPGDPLITFTQLPHGYRVIAQARNNTTNRAADYYFYGHPKGHFDLAHKAYVHFKHIWLGNLANCTCTRCNVRAPAVRKQAFWQLRL